MPDKDYQFKAILKSLNLIEVHIPKSYNGAGCTNFYLYEDGEYVKELHIQSRNENSKFFTYNLDEIPELKMGVDYEIYDERNIVIPLNCSYLCRLDKYIDRTYFDGELGAIYSKEKTIFRLFSPLATYVTVYIYTKEDEEIHSLSRRLVKDEKTGVFECEVEGDLEGCPYSYIVKVNGKYNEAVDPYAKAVTRNSRHGVIIDFSKVDIPLNEECLPKFEKITDAVIYELDVRDFTSQEKTPFANKGKFLGMTETGYKTKKGIPMGIDYLESLGVTHVQILPFYDFCTTSDDHPQDTYNWGYDPLNYNSPEGSYSSNPNDPYSRVLECKKMVASLHEKGLRVVMDVVYNHVFNMELSNFEAICPNYYFKFNADGSKSDGSFCGNEFESRHLMARKFIVDSCVHWVKNYGIDGLRFDLMGLIDVTTINEVYRACSMIKPDFIIYGEGWDMPTCMPSNQRANMNNAHLMPNIGHFNDRFRDTSKGKTNFSELYIRGYLTGDTNYRDGFKHIFAGSTLPLAFPPLFNDPKQSINYVECHDNNTIYDKLKVCCYDDSEDELFRRLKVINAVVLLSCGVPFIHMGQEIGLSKNGDHNSYRSGDLINQMKWDVLDKRKDLYDFFRQIVEIRKKYPFFRISEKETIEKSIRFIDEANGCLIIDYFNEEILGEFKNVKIFINPTKNKINVNLYDYYQIIFNESGSLISEFYSQHLTINSLSLVIACKK